MSSAGIEMQLWIGGIVHFGVLSASALVPRTLDWRGELAKLHPFLRKLVWVYGAFIVLVIVGFGVISLTCASELASGTPLARAVCGFVAIFWLARVLVAALVFDARPFLRNALLKIGYAVLNAAFVYLTIAYGVAAIRAAHAA